jgi:hypothetical protein
MVFAECGVNSVTGRTVLLDRLNTEHTANVR